MIALRILAVTSSEAADVLFVLSPRKFHCFPDKFLQKPIVHLELSPYSIFIL